MSQSYLEKRDLRARALKSIIKAIEFRLKKNLFLKTYFIKIDFLDIVFFSLSLSPSNPYALNICK